MDVHVGHMLRYALYLHKIIIVLILSYKDKPKVNMLISLINPYPAAALKPVLDTYVKRGRQ